MKKLKTTKLRYYGANCLKHLVPNALYQRRLKAILESGAGCCDSDNIRRRVDYYNQISTAFSPSENARSYGSLSLKSDDCSFASKQHSIPSAYYFDFKESARYFKGGLYFDYWFADVTEIPPVPTFVKSRPIRADNRNSIVLKLDKLRHFVFVNDMAPFVAKRDEAVFRGPCYQPHRKSFVARCLAARNCNVGDTNKAVIGQDAYKAPLTIKEQLRYKYVISVEGNDVATNLKWIMSSNSLCLMTKPKFETWFMEGLLVPDHHYALLKDDYSDLEEKIDYYNARPDEALAIIDRAHRFVDQFRDEKRERLISLLVMKKYFELSRQKIENL
mgnify:CR=1 FL=1